MRYNRPFYDIQNNSSNLLVHSRMLLYHSSDRSSDRSSDATVSRKVVGRKCGVRKRRHAHRAGFYGSEYLNLSHVSVATILMVR